MFKSILGKYTRVNKSQKILFKNTTMGLFSLTILAGCSHNEHCERLAERGYEHENRYCICRDFDLERERRRLINAGYEGRELELRLTHLRSYNCDSSPNMPTGPSNSGGGDQGSSSASAGGGEASASATQNGHTSRASGGGGAANSSAGPTNEPIAVASAGGGSASATGGLSGTVSSGNP